MAAPGLEAIILAGGQAERLGDAAGGRPKALVEVAGRPLAAYQVARLVAAEEPERLGRGGGIKFAAALRQTSGDVLALNGDELLDVDFGALLARHRQGEPLATIAVAQPKSQFGVVAVDDQDVVRGFEEAGRVPYWVNCGQYVLTDEAIARFPDRGDHESTTFPELAAEGRLHAFRHDGLWLTVNTPKELRTARDHVAAHPEWLA